MNNLTDEGLHSYFLHWLDKRPDATAIATKEKAYSYRDVFAYTSVVADKISRWDASSDAVRICLLAPKSVYAYAAQQAVMLKSHIFVPLSVKYPLERNEYIVGHCHAEVILVDASSLELGLQISENSSRDIAVIQIDKPLPNIIASEPVRSFGHDESFDSSTTVCTPAVSKCEQLAYIIYTSGTSGLPKGVPVTHASAVKCIENVFTLLETHADDKFSQLAELSFDFSVSEIFLCWKSGGTLCIPSQGDNIAPVSYINRHQLTVWSCVPSTIEHMEMLGLLKQPGSLPSIRASYFCGSALKSDIARQWSQAAVNSIIFNFYGPTEAAVFATWHVFNPKTDTESVVAIGKPLLGFETALVAENSSEIVKTSLGELLLAGPQVSSGYWDNVVATQHAFITLEVPGCQSRFWYRTGDLAQYNDKGELEFKGRADHQVKVSGYRVELQEIELVLEKHTQCKQVAVIYGYNKIRDEEVLTAFCQSQDKGITEQVQQAAKQYLPEYMRPNHIELVSSLPLNANGKVDYPTLKRRLS